MFLFFELFDDNYLIKNKLSKFRIETAANKKDCLLYYNNLEDCWGAILFALATNLCAVSCTGATIDPNIIFYGGKLTTKPDVTITLNTTNKYIKIGTTSMWNHWMVMLIGQINNAITSISWGN